MEHTDDAASLTRLLAGDTTVLAPAVASVLAAAGCRADREAGVRGPAGDAVVADTAGALGAEAARAGLSPDQLFAVLDDGVRCHLAERDDAAASRADAPPGRALGLADAVVLLLWRTARHRYHDTRALLDARARRGGGATGPVAPRAA
jgi:hypothetical protein